MPKESYENRLQALRENYTHASIGAIEKNPKSQTVKFHFFSESKGDLTSTFTFSGPSDLSEFLNVITTSFQDLNQLKSKQKNGVIYKKLNDLVDHCKNEYDCFHLSAESDFMAGTEKNVITMYGNKKQPCIRKIEIISEEDVHNIADFLEDYGYLKLNAEFEKATNKGVITSTRANKNLADLKNSEATTDYRRKFCPVGKGRFNR